MALSRNWKNIEPIFLAVVAGISLPCFCLGYNVFALMDYSRAEKVQARFNITGVTKVRDSSGQVGLRDRYRMEPDDRKPSSFEDMCLFAKIEFTSIEPFPEDCICFRCRKYALGGIGSLYPSSVPYLIVNPDTILFIDTAPYFAIVKSDSMHLLDRDLHLAYSDAIVYAKRVDSFDNLLTCL